MKGWGPIPSKRDGSNLLGFGKNCGDKCERGPLQASYTTSTNGEGYQCSEQKRNSMEHYVDFYLTFGLMIIQFERS